MNCIMCFIMIAREKCIRVNILHVPMTKYNRLDYMIKYCSLLHIFYTTLYNSMNEKQPRFSLISYTHARTYYIKSHLAPIIHLYILIQIYILIYFCTHTYINPIINLYVHVRIYIRIYFCTYT